MTFRILITSAGGGLVPQALQYLRHASRHGRVSVVAVDTRSDATGRHFADHFHVVPRGNEPGYAEALAGISARYGVDLVLPWSDDEAVAAARSRHLFEVDGRQLACADIAVLETLADKIATYRTLSGKGLPVPRFEQARNESELAAAVDMLLGEGLDLAVKPAVSRGGRDVSVIRADVSGAQEYAGGREVHMDAASFRSSYLHRYREHFPVIVMERLFEPTFDLDMLARQGKLQRVLARRRLNPAVPNDGHVIEDRADLYALGPKIVEAFNLTWLYDCDIMLDKAGQPRILEINPRPSGSAAVAVAAGVPLLDDLISLAKGEALPAVDIPYGRIVVPYQALAVPQAGGGAA